MSDAEIVTGGSVAVAMRIREWKATLGAGGVLTLLFVLLALFLYYRAEAGVVEKHSQDQQFLARLAATALEQRLDSLLHTVEGLSAVLSKTPPTEWNHALPSLAGVPRGGNIFLVRPDGTLRFRTPPRSRKSLADAIRPWVGARAAVLTNPHPLGASDSQVTLLVPLESNGRARAQMGLTVPFAPFVEAFVSPGGAPANTNLSLLDEQGRVLINARHSEMIGRQIPGPGQDCLPCHSSFALEHRMLKGDSGVDHIRVDGDSLALLAFTPVRVLGRRWSLSISEPYSAIIAETRQGFRAIIFLLGLVLLVGMIATIVTLQHRFQRRRAEERAQLAEQSAALEREKRQTEQLAAMGKMTSQIAHQINTPLATLGLDVAYLREEVAHSLNTADPQIGEVCSEIAGEIDRLKHVVNDYLRFSRLPQAVFSAASLRNALQGYLDFILPEAREREVQIEIDLGEDLPPVRLDSELFRQAFLNLVRNSFEAMPSGGTLRLRVTTEGAYVVLRLKDTGRGIPPSALPHIFEPFFTTKKEGTGLGLVHARRIVEEHGGTIHCESRAGEGTTFSILLPALAPSAQTSEIFALAGKGR